MPCHYILHTQMCSRRKLYRAFHSIIFFRCSFTMEQRLETGSISADRRRTTSGRQKVWIAPRRIQTISRWWLAYSSAWCHCHNIHFCLRFCRYRLRWLSTFARCSSRTSWSQLSVGLSRIEAKLSGARSCWTRFLRWDTYWNTNRNTTVFDGCDDYVFSNSCRWFILALLVVGWQENVSASVTKTIAHTRTNSLHVRTQGDVNWPF